MRRRKQEENGGSVSDSGSGSVQEERERERKRTSNVSVYVHSLLWLAAAVFIWHYGKLSDVLSYDPRPIRSMLWLGWTSLGVGAIVVVYLAFYVPLVDGVSLDDLQSHCPNAVFGGMMSGVVMLLSFTVALWPVWSWITPLIVAVFGIAGLLSTNFIPSF